MSEGQKSYLRSHPRIWWMVVWAMIIATILIFVSAFGADNVWALILDAWETGKGMLGNSGNGVPPL